MKIGSVIKNRDGSPRNVHVNGTKYIFAPEKDASGKVHFVADVTNEDDAAVFGASEAFYAYGPEMEPKPKVLIRGGQKEVVPPAVPLGSAFTEEQLTEAGALLSGTVSDVSAAVSKVTSMDVVRAAIELEAAQKKPRTQILELLTKTIEYAAQAGA